MRFLAALLACVALAGCATETPEEEVSYAFAETAAGVIAEAEAGGAGDAQLAILEQAKSDGKLSLEDARTAAHAMITCLKDAGSDGFYQETTTESGLILPLYNAAADTPEQMAIADGCDAQEAFWVNMLYQTQPASLQVNQVYLDQQAPVVRACLEREGYATAPGATTHELLRQAADVLSETKGATDCLEEAKIRGF